MVQPELKSYILFCLVDIFSIICVPFSLLSSPSLDDVDFRKGMHLELVNCIFIT